MIPRFSASTMARISWTTGSFGLIQFTRLVNNVLLARLLAPPLFGLMVIVNAIRTGVELLSDVGINQNIVSNAKGHTPEFYDTAWTIQVVRGVFLGALCLLLAKALAASFGQPELALVLPVMALLFVFGGFQSTGGALLQRQVAVTRTSIFEVMIALISLFAHVGLALVTPTIWALVLGSVIAGAASLVGSFLLVPGLRHRFVIHRPSARQILVFGKWIFLSSVIYFFAMNFDRLYFATRISLVELGVYGIARALADMFSSLAVRSTSLLLFPTVAAMRVSEWEVRTSVRHGRRGVLLVVALGLGCLVAVSDVVIALLYDPRYAGAAVVLPLLLLGLWFAILGTVNDSIMLGTARPAYPALSNAAKLLTYIVGVPLAFHYHGFLAAILVLNAGEIVRYVVLWTFSRKKHLGFGRDDLALTILFVVVVLTVRQLLSALGLTGDIDVLFPVLRPEFWAQ